MRSIITDEQKQRIIKEANGNVTDLQLARNLGLKYATYMHWKGKFRKEGLIKMGTAGRPPFGSKLPTVITTTEEFARMTKEEQEAIVKAKLAEVMASLTNTDPASN